MTQRESSIDRATAAELREYATTVRELTIEIDNIAGAILDDSGRLPISKDTYHLLFGALELVTIAGNLLDPDRSEGPR